MPIALLNLVDNFREIIHKTSCKNRQIDQVNVNQRQRLWLHGYVKIKHDLLIFKRLNYNVIYQNKLYEDLRN